MQLISYQNSISLQDPSKECAPAPFWSTFTPGDEAFEVIIVLVVLVGTFLCMSCPSFCHSLDRLWFRYTAATFTLLWIKVSLSVLEAVRYSRSDCPAQKLITVFFFRQLPHFFTLKMLLKNKLVSKDL